MKNKFLKMQGLGNDFIVFDSTHAQLKFSPEQIKKISHRKFGIGCDQVLFIEKPKNSETDFFYRIFNADGTEAKQCDNGARCIALFIQKKNLSEKSKLKIGTKSGTIITEVVNENEVMVDMGVPSFMPSDIPFITERVAKVYQIQLNDNVHDFSVVSIGNPHVALVVEDLSKIEIASIGSMISNLKSFPEGVNVNFMEIKNSSKVNLKVYERGVGETMACGSGACASVAIGIYRGFLNNEVQVCQPGGNLMVNWKNENSSIFMTGPASIVYEGIFET